MAGRFCGYENIVSKIQAAGGQAYYSSPFAYPNPGDFDAVLERIGDLCKKDGKKYIYAYCSEPDATMHRWGSCGAYEGRDGDSVDCGGEKVTVLHMNKKTWQYYP